MPMRIMIVFLLLTAIVAATGMAAFSGVGHSQMRQRAPCAPLPILEKALAQEYDEALFAVGAIGDLYDVRFYVSAERRSWTVLRMKRGNSLACVVAAGKDFATPPVDRTPPGSPL